LGLNSNKFSEIPAELGNLTKLNTLNLAGNELYSLPDSLANLTKLRALDLSGNPITELPDSLKGLESLADVKFGNSVGVDSWLQVVLGSSQVVYTGGALTPGVTVRNGSMTLGEGADYTVSYLNNVNVGTATGTIKIVGSSRSTSVSFQVVPAQAASLAASVADVQWTGKQVKPAPKVTFGGVALVNGVDYTLSYGANKAIGKATVNVVGKGNFAGVKVVAFKVVPKKSKVSKATAGKKQVAVSWSKVSKSQKVSKYEVRYRAKGTSKWTVKAFAAKTAKTTVKKLKKGKVYQFQVRSFKTVSGAKYYSAWSATKASKKVK
jgi:hypothetical protein